VTHSVTHSVTHFLLAGNDRETLFQVRMFQKSKQIEIKRILEKGPEFFLAGRTIQ